MKIFFANYAPIIKYGIGHAFAEMGHEVRFEHVGMEGDAWLYSLNEFNPDFVFTEGAATKLEKLFPLLKEKNIPHIYWAIEDPVAFDYLSLPFARESLHVYTPCIESIPMYQNHGINAHLMMFACNPSYHKTGVADARFNHDIVFVGNNYGGSIYSDREIATRNMLGSLMERNYNIKIYGNEWWLDRSRPFSIDTNFYGGYLANEDLANLCASVPIILGLHTVSSSKTMMSMRTFEILGCRGFHLTQWTPAIEQLFKNHHHLVWTKSAEETVELVEYYLKKPSLRAQIAQQGQNEVYAKHTYQHRVRDILNEMNSSRNIPINVYTNNNNVRELKIRSGVRIQIQR